MVKAEFRSRVIHSLDIQERQTEVLSRLKDISWLWSSTPEQAQFFSADEIQDCFLNPFLKKGIRGSVSYGPRYSTGVPDKAMYDDILTLSIDENRVHYAEFSGLVFEKVVSAFTAYRAAIIVDLNIYSNDHEDIVELAQTTGKDIDGRDTVYRFNPVNYFDDQLCHRAFGYGAEEVVARLNGEVERAAIVDFGALVIASTDLMDRDNLLALHNHIAGFLT